MTSVAVFGPQRLVEVLRERSPGDVFVDASRPKPPGPDDIEVLLVAGGTDGGSITRLLDQTPTIRWLATSSSGVDRLREAGVLRRVGLVLTNSGSLGGMVAEHALALMLSATRHIPEYTNSKTRAEWPAVPKPSIELAGATVVIYGLGTAGLALARMTKALDMTVVAVRRQDGAPPSEVDRIATLASLPREASKADFLVVMVPLTEETRGTVDAEVLAGMRPSAWLINVARGPVVSELDLIASLQAGRIAGAGLDVFDIEPLPSDHPYWSMPNVIITPHVAATRSPWDDRTVGEFLANLERFKAGLPLDRTVDSQRGY